MVMKLIAALLVTFQLGMTVAQARAVCPKPLMTAYEKLHTQTHFVCDDGKDVSVLIFDAVTAKLVAIMDVRYFAKQ